MSELPAIQHAGRVLARIYDRTRAVFQFQVADRKFVHLNVLWAATPPPDYMQCPEGRQ